MMKFEKTGMGSTLLMGSVFAVIGVLIILFGNWFENNDQTYQELCDTSITATVIENREEISGDSSSVYPVFRYQYNGKTYETKSRTGSYPPKYQVGENVELLISADDPNLIYISGDNTAKLITFIFKAFGWVFVAFGCAYPLIRKLFDMRYEREHDLEKYE